MRARQIIHALVFSLVGCSAGGPDDTSDSDADAGTTDAGTTDAGTSATTTGLELEPLVLTDLDAFQVIAIPLMDAGAAVQPDLRPAPIVADRAVVLRASVQVPPEWSPVDVELRVDVTRGGETSSFSATSLLTDSTDPADASSGLTVELPAAVVRPDARYSVALYTDPQTPVARFPEEDDMDTTAALSPVETGPIKIHIVPFEVDGITPDTSEDVIDEFAAAVFAYYPTTRVDITVGDVQPNPYPELPPSQALGDALFDVGVLMEQTDQAPADVYYYGLMQPAATRDDYEGITGSSQELDYRAGFAIGAGFGDPLSASTLVHELGHLHFLKHAPCGSPADVDPLFPHDDGMARAEGYDVRSDSFIDLDEASDLMSYCQPRWVSAYHYEKMAQWVQVTQGW